jgi:hypothetical protein
VHLHCATPQTVQIEYPRAQGEVSQRQKHNTQLLASCITSMNPPLRPFYTQNLITLQTGPILAHILEPTVKLVRPRSRPALTPVVIGVMGRGQGGVVLFVGTLAEQMDGWAMDFSITCRDLSTTFGDFC